MADADSTALPAGDFTGWITDMQAALRGEHDADVPCDGCTACCRSSQFIHIEPDETAALAAIPPRLLFPAPGLPHGHVILGYDDRGHCPMLVDDACSIYEHRPRTCRTYDCRIYPAAGIDPGEDATRVEIARRTARWRFDVVTPADRARRDAVRAAADFLRDHGPSLGEDSPSNATRRAVVAVELHELFLRRDDETDATVATDPDPHVIRDELRRRSDQRNGA